MAVAICPGRRRPRARHSRGCVRPGSRCRMNGRPVPVLLRPHSRLMHKMRPRTTGSSLAMKAMLRPSPWVVSRRPAPPTTMRWDSRRRMPPWSSTSTCVRPVMATWGCSTPNDADDPAGPPGSCANARPYPWPLPLCRLIYARRIKDCPPATGRRTTRLFYPVVPSVPPALGTPRPQPPGFAQDLAEHHGLGEQRTVKDRHDVGGTGGRHDRCPCHRYSGPGGRDVERGSRPSRCRHSPGHRPPLRRVRYPGISRP